MAGGIIRKKRNKAPRSRSIDRKVNDYLYRKNILDNNNQSSDPANGNNVRVYNNLYDMVAKEDVPGVLDDENTSVSSNVLRMAQRKTSKNSGDDVHLECVNSYTGMGHDDFYLNPIDINNHGHLADVHNSTLYIRMKDGRIITETHNGIPNVVGTPVELEKHFRCCKWSNRSELLAVGASCNDLSHRGKVYLFSLRKQRFILILSIPGSEHVVDIQWSVDDSCIYICTRRNGVWKYVISRGDLSQVISADKLNDAVFAINTPPLDTSLCSIKLNCTNSMIAVGMNNNKFAVIDISNSNRIVVSRYHTSCVKAMEWCPDDRTLLMTGGGSLCRRLALWKVKETGIVKVNSIHTSGQISSCFWIKNARRNRYDAAVTFRYMDESATCAMVVYNISEQVTKPLVAKCTSLTRPVLAATLHPQRNELWTIDTLADIRRTMIDVGEADSIPSKLDISCNIR